MSKDNRIETKAAPAIGAPELALITITCMWGATFLIVHNAVAASGALLFVGMRFGVAALLPGLIFFRQVRGLTRAELAAGALIGVSIFGGYSLQTYGLMSISSSRSAFITAFYVPFVPILQWLVLRQRPSLMAWIAVGIAFVGLVLITGPDGVASGISSGDLLTMLGAVAIAAEILLISRVAPGLNIVRVTVVQLATASLLALGGALISREPTPELNLLYVGSAIALGVMSAIIQYVMNWAQKRIAATKATLIYAGEPIWAGLVGAIAGERITPLAAVGALLIVCANIIGELKLKKIIKTAKTEKTAQTGSKR
ncbi:DMT family transporter [Herbaspirillum lusitanum]|uniref:DMT family transporter n=1 Tax=Herbaspirillum lusitanum TaxID=213312 RepID=A0ABW9AA33_9BURK